MKGKGEREIYAQLYAEFQRKARRNKKIFLKEQCKEVEENNRMGKTEISSMKWEISRQHFMQGMGMMKDRSNKDLIRSRRD